MSENLVVFAVLGFLAGAAPRVFYPGPQPTRILGTAVLGMAGGLLGGLLSRAFWPAADGQFSSAALLTSALGAVVVIALWAGVAYGGHQRVQGHLPVSPRKPPPAVWLAPDRSPRSPVRGIHRSRTNGKPSRLLWTPQLASPPGGLPGVGGRGHSGSDRRLTH